MRTGELPRRLGLADSVTIVAGTIIGAGIFLTPSMVARQLPSAGWILAVWAFSGALSLCGALAVAELGAMFPSTGGQYIYLRECFGPLAAFLSAWTSFFVFSSAAIAWLAVSFAMYLGFFVPLGPAAAKAVAVGLLAVIVAVNYCGVKTGARVQMVFTVLKAAGLGLLIVAAFSAPARVEPAEAAPVSSAALASRFGAAMIACLLTYDGWIALSSVAGEVRNPQRTLPRALTLGIGACVALYMLANLAYLRVLSPGEIAAAGRVGTAAAERALGSMGAAVVSAAILASIVGCLNGWMLTAPRIYFAQARDGLFFDRFGAVHPRFLTPSQSILLQGTWAAVLVVTGSFAALASYAMFAAWLFYGITVLGMVVLRRRRPELARPYRMAGYPVAPLMFSAVAFGFVINTFLTTPGPALTASVLIAGGVPVYWLRRGTSTSERRHGRAA